MVIDTSNIPCIVFLVIIVIIIAMYFSQGSSSCACMSYGPCTREEFGETANSATTCQTLCDLAAAPGGPGCQAGNYNPALTSYNCNLIAATNTANLIPVVVPGAVSNYIVANKPSSILSNTFLSTVPGEYDKTGLIVPAYTETSLTNCSLACNAMPSCISFVYDTSAQKCHLHSAIGNQTATMNNNATTYFGTGIIRDKSLYNTLPNVVYVPITTGRFVRFISTTNITDMMVSGIQVYGSAADMTNKTGYITPAATLQKAGGGSDQVGGNAQWISGSFSWTSSTVKIMVLVIRIQHF